LGGIVGSSAKDRSTMGAEANNPMTPPWVVDAGRETMATHHFVNN
jgi:hypothetical protein